MAARVNSRPLLLAGEDLAPAPQQARSLAKRTRLKEAALIVFGEKGYERASIEDIAQRARMAVGGFYQHFRSKRQLLLVLMDELLAGLERLALKPASAKDIRAVIHGLLTRAFSHDLHYVGAYQAWREAVLSDPALARQNEAIHAWTAQRVLKLFQFLQQLPGARSGVDLPQLARTLDTVFWSMLSEARLISKKRLHRQIATATHLIYHALFTDPAK